MSVAKATLVLILLLGLAPDRAIGQSSKSDNRQIDLKPLLPPVLPPLPSNSALTPGAVGTGSQSPHSSSLYNSRDTTSPAPGLRFSIPTR